MKLFNAQARADQQEYNMKMEANHKEAQTSNSKFQSDFISLFSQVVHKF
jgi:hypothetical protein